MWRAFLSLVLIGTNLCGSPFCCCAVGSLAEVIIGQAENSVGSCCCSSTDGTGDGPQHGPGSGHECPCKKHRQFASAPVGGGQIVLSTVTQARWDWILVNVGQLTLCKPSISAELDAFGSWSCAFPHLDRGGILRVKQALRC